MTGYLSKNSRKLAFRLGIIFLVILAVGFYLKQKPTEFLGFGRLVPNPSSDRDGLCAKIKLPSPDVTSKLAWPTESTEPCEFLVQPVSLSEDSSTKYVSFSASGSGKVDVYFDNMVRRLEINNPQFTDVFFKLDNINAPERSYVKIRRVSGGIFIRERIEFLDSSYPVVRIVAKSLDSDSYPQVVLLSVLSLIFLYLIIFEECARFPFALSSIFGILFFLSPKLFYYFDEWHILERFSRMGFSGVIHTHNEHSIIAFFAWYYALVQFFGENYFALLVVSILLHVLCAYSLERLLLMYHFDRRASRASAIFFMFSSLHTEVLQWAFEQCIILSCLSGIWALVYLKKWMLSDRYAHLVISGLLLLLSPLLFGNGFIFFPLAFSVIVIELRFTNMRRYIVSSIAMSGAAVVPVLVYHALKQVSVTSGSGDVKEGFDLLKFTAYFITGSGLGTIGRGLGFYPNLTLSSVQTFCYEALGYYVPWIDRRVIFESSVEPSLGAYLWMFLIILMGLIFWCKKEVRRFLPASLVGLVLLTLSFLLPAVGRTHLGALQSLSLRYQYSAMLGLSMILCPLFYALLRTKLSRLAFYLLSFLWMSEQAYLCQTFTYFTDHGNLHRVYVEELLDWERKGMKGEGAQYEGSDDMKGLFPLVRPSITPGTSPTGILKIAKWLRGES